MADLEALKKQIDALDPPSRLELAAGLLRAGKAQIAHTIAERVVLELGTALALAELKKAGKRG